MEAELDAKPEMRDFLWEEFRLVGTTRAGWWFAAAAAILCMLLLAFCFFSKMCSSSI